MEKKHNFVHLAEVQREQGTLYCAGLDVHSFGGLSENLGVYNSALTTPAEQSELREAKAYYETLLSGYLADRDILGLLLASVEGYLKKIINILVYKCNIRVFKPQLAFYEQFGPAGFFLLARIREYITDQEISSGERLMTTGDCKRGDIDTTQAAYFTGLLDSLLESWGVDYTPFGFDIINVSPWMGSDVLVLGTLEKPGLGLRLMREGHGIIVVNKSSNPSGPDYQDLLIADQLGTVQMLNVQHLSMANQHFDLDYDGLSAIGLVVGSTHACDGSIRQIFPSTTLLVPGFGAQGGKFHFIMPELIREGKWTGQGAIFSSSRGTMFSFLEKLGGSGQIANLETDLIKAVDDFRDNEKKAYETPEVQAMGITYPFN